MERYFNTFKNKDIFDKVLGKEAIAVLSRKFKIDFFCNYDCDVIRWTEEENKLKILYESIVYINLNPTATAKINNPFIFKK